MHPILTADDKPSVLHGVLQPIWQDRREKLHEVCPLFGQFQWTVGEARFFLSSYSSRVVYSYSQGKKGREKLQLSCLQRMLPTFNGALAFHAPGVHACSQNMAEDVKCVLKAGRSNDTPGHSHSASACR